MTIILGIDPGSRRTGFGIIKLEGYKQIYLESGHIDVASFKTNERLRLIFLGIQEVIRRYNPTEAAIEQVFMHKNPNSALKLGQARGAAMVAFDVPIAEYTARQVKQSVVGHGAANKEQIQFMVKRLLNIVGHLQADAADALAIALCHANARKFRFPS